MRDEQIPDWLVEALSATEPRPRAPEAQTPVEVHPGDICVVYPFSRSDAVGRLFLVRDTGEGWCEGMLAGVETELATEVDAVLSADLTGLGYPVAVHSRFHGPVWITQVARRVGSVGLHVLDDLERLAWNDEAGVELALGLPLQPKGIDPRYPALEALSTELDVLTDHCRRRRNELSQPLLDPVLADVDILHQLLTEPGWEAALTRAVSTPQFRDRLLAALPELSKDERRVVMPFIERAALSTSRPEPAATVGEVVADHRDPLALAQAVAQHPVPAVTVLTHRHCWERSIRRSVRLQVESDTEYLITAVAIGEYSMEVAA